MGTCALLGQAVGTGVALAVKSGTSLRRVDVPCLQQMLMHDDCFLPGLRRQPSAKTLAATITAEVLRNGLDRDYEGEDNAWSGEAGEPIELTFAEPTMIERVRLVFDSHLNRDHHNMPCLYRLNEPRYRLPQTLVRAYDVVGLRGGEEILLARVENNRRRLVYHLVEQTLDGVRIIPRATWGAQRCRIFSLDAE
jgi:hypothetical protein